MRGQINQVGLKSDWDALQKQQKRSTNMTSTIWRTNTRWRWGLQMSRKNRDRGMWHPTQIRESAPTTAQCKIEKKILQKSKENSTTSFMYTVVKKSNSRKHREKIKVTLIQEANSFQVARAQTWGIPSKNRQLMCRGQPRGPYPRVWWVRKNSHITHEFA